MNFNEVISKFNIASFIFLGLFVASCIVQLVLAFLEKEKIRRIEKPFCLLTLALFALVTIPNQPLIYVGAFLGMAGDILVVVKDKKYFALGAFSFFLGHISYVIEIIIVFLKASIPWPYLLVLFACFIVFFIALFIGGQKFVGNIPEAVGMALYYATLFDILPLMIIANLSIGSFMYLGIIGISFFIISDVIILITKYIKSFKKYDFFIMLTYLIAQFFIVNALVFTYISLGL